MKRMRYSTRSTASETKGVGRFYVAMIVDNTQPGEEARNEI